MAGLVGNLLGLFSYVDILSVKLETPISCTNIKNMDGEAKTDKANLYQSDRGTILLVALQF